MGDTLNIRGNDSANHVSVVWIGNDRFAVVGINTDIKGNNATGPNSGYEYKTFSGIRNIDIDLKGGNDLLGVGNDIPTLAAAAANPPFNFNLHPAQLEADLNLLGGTINNDFELDKQLKIRMSSGNDSVVVTSADIGLRIDADLGSGNNNFTVDPTEIGDDLILRAGSGNDIVNIVDTEIAQMLDVDLGDGNNELSMRVSDIHNHCLVSSIGESADIRTGKGRDDVNFSYTNISDNFKVRTGAGNDEVEYYGGQNGLLIIATIDHSADIDTGSGHDYVEFEDARVGDILKIVTGDGSDGVTVCHTTVGDDLDIQTGNDADGIFVGICSEDEPGYEPAILSVYNVVVGDDLLINAGAGDDGRQVSCQAYDAPAGVNVFNVRADDNLEIHLGDGHDTADAESVRVGHDAFVNGNAGDDRFTLVTFDFAHDLHVDMGDGKDEANLFEGEVHHNVFVNLGSGNDTFRTTKLLVDDDIHLDAGSGRDTIDYRQTLSDNFFANLGSDNDKLTLSEVTIREKAELDGGSGRDTLEDGGFNDINDQEDNNFEVFLP